MTSVAASVAAEPWSLPAKGRAGILLLILTETAFFSIFVAAYIFYIGKSLSGPYPRDVLEIPVVNTVCLLSSSLTIVLAVRALRGGSSGGVRRLVADHSAARP